MATQVAVAGGRILNTERCSVASIFTAATIPRSRRSDKSARGHAVRVRVLG